MTGFSFEQHGITFDVADYVDENGEIALSSGKYQLLPEGEYLVGITDSAEQRTAKGGTMLVMTYSVLNGPYEGVELKDRLNIINDNPTAQQIAAKSMAKIVQSCGLSTIKNTAELHGKRLLVKVGIEAGSGTYINKNGETKPRSDQNKIKDYYPATATPAPRQAVAEKPAQPEGPVAGAIKKAPWAAK